LRSRLTHLVWAISLILEPIDKLSHPEQAQKKKSDLKYK